MATKKLSKADREAVECYDLWRKLMRSKPELTDEQIERMAQVFIDQLHHLPRLNRAALASLGRSGKQLDAAFGRKATADSADAAAQLFEALDGAAAWLRSVADCYNTAAARLLLTVGVREDSAALIAAAKTNSEQVANA